MSAGLLLMHDVGHAVTDQHGNCFVMRRNLKADRLPVCFCAMCLYVLRPALCNGHSFQVNVIIRQMRVNTGIAMGLYWA